MINLFSCNPFGILLTVLWSAVAQPTVQVDWPQFLSRSDPINRFAISQPLSIPDIWLEGSWAGNGLLGTQVLICPGGICRQSLLMGMNKTWPPFASTHQVVLPLVRGDITDIRTGKLGNFTTGDPQPRMGAGDLILRATKGAILRGTIRTHLANATITANIVTTQGLISVSVFVHATRQLVVVTGHGTGGEDDELVWDFVPAPPMSPHYGRLGPFFSDVPPDYQPNPEPTCGPANCVQQLLASPEGLGWATTWRKSAKRLLVSLTTDLPRPMVGKKLQNAADEGASALDAAASLDPAALISEHTRW